MLATLDGSRTVASLSHSRSTVIPLNSLRNELLEIGGGSIERTNDTHTIIIAKGFLKKIKPALSSDAQVGSSKLENNCS